MDNMTITQLRAKARKKRATDCPPYSKMTKAQLIRYLSGYNKTNADSIELTKNKMRKKRPISRTLSLPQSSTLSLPQSSKEPTKHKELVMRQENYPRPDSPNAPRFIRRTKGNPKRKKTIRLKKKSSDPYYLQDVFKEKVKPRKKQNKNKNDLSSMKVVDLKKKLKQNKLKTSGKKSELIHRLEEFQKFNNARHQLNQFR